MASFSKASQGVLRVLKPWLGIPDSLFGHGEDDSDEDDGSIWRIPSQATTLVPSEASTGSNATVLKHHRSPTDTDNKSWSRSLRSLAAYFNAEENIRPFGPSYDAATKTPEKRVRVSPRKPLPWIRSSLRSRGAISGKFNAHDTAVLDDGDPRPMTSASSTAPVLDVDIPRSNLAVDTEHRSMLADESLMQAYRSSQRRDPRLLAQHPEDPSASPLPRQESDQVPGKIGWKFPVAGNPNDAYHELLQGPRNSSESSVVAKASSSNDSDVEDNDEDEEYSGAGILELHAAAKSKIHLSLDSHAKSPSSDLATASSSERTIPLSHYLKTPSPPSKGRVMLRKSQSIRKNLNRLQQTLAGSFKGRPTLQPRAPSYASDADAEDSVEGSPPCPSMGSRHEWQERRIERNRRYAEAVADNPPTEDDSESGEESLQLSRAPTRRSMNPAHRKSGSLTGVQDVGQPPSSSSNTGDLRYAVEANERRSADELSVRNLRYAIEAIDRPSAMELEGCEEGAAAAAAETPHMRIPLLPDSQDPYEAALLAAGLQPEKRQSWIPTLESLRELDDTVAGGSIASVAVILDGLHVRGTNMHAGLLGAGMGAPRPLHRESEIEAKVFNTPASSSDAGSEGEEGCVGVEAVGHEQTGSMDGLQEKKAGDKRVPARYMMFVDSGVSAGESESGSSQNDTISID